MKAFAVQSYNNYYRYTNKRGNTNSVETRPLLLTKGVLVVIGLKSNRSDRASYLSSMCFDDASR